MQLGTIVTEWSNKWSRNYRRHVLNADTDGDGVTDGKKENR
jgi:hypothetical protein